MLSTLICLPVSIPLGTVSLARVSFSGVAMVLTQKHQKKLTKVTKLVDIVTSAITVFEMSVSKALNNGEIDKQEFAMLQTSHLKAVNELANVDCKMEAKTRAQLHKKSTGRNQQPQEGHKRCLVMCTLFTVCYFMCYQCQKWISWQGSTTNRWTYGKGHQEAERAQQGEVESH